MTDHTRVFETLINELEILEAMYRRRVQQQTWTEQDDEYLQTRLTVHLTSVRGTRQVLLDTEPYRARP